MTVKETADYIESALVESGISLESWFNCINIFQTIGHEIRDELWWRVEQRKRKGDFQ